MPRSLFLFLAWVGILHSVPTLNGHEGWGDLPAAMRCTWLHPPGCLFVSSLMLGYELIMLQKQFHARPLAWVHPIAVLVEVHGVALEGEC